MTRLTEVGVAPAEPLGDRATELALELNVVCTVFLTVLYARANTNCRALGTD
jgi:hypothetical protein